MTLVLNDERFGMQQEFATVEELNSEIEKCAREWYPSANTGATLEQYIALCQEQALDLAEEKDESIFEGWKENGQYRMQWLSFGAWEVFQKDGNAFVRIGQHRGNKSETIEEVVAYLIDSEDFDHS